MAPRPRRGPSRPGFVPGAPTCPSARLGSNPFLELRHFGITLELEAREPPALDRDLLIALRESWQDATGRE